MEKRLNSFIFQPFIYIWFICNLRFDGGRSAKLKSCIDVSTDIMLFCLLSHSRVFPIVLKVLVRVRYSTCSV